MLKKLFLGLMLIGSQVNAVINIHDSRIDKQALLYGAIREGNIELIKLLIKAGVNVNQEGNGQTPLFLAVEKWNIDIVKILLNAGANANHMCLHNGSILTFVSIIGCPLIEMYELLINAGVDVNAKDNLGCNSTLRNAVQNNCTDIVKLLIATGVDVNAKDYFGNTALYYAVENNFTDIIKLFIDAGANINESALYYAVKNNPTDVAKLLITASADLNVKEIEILIKLACGRGNFELIELLQSL